MIEKNIIENTKKGQNIYTMSYLNNKWELTKEECFNLNNQKTIKIESYFQEVSSRFDIETNSYYRIIRINHKSNYKVILDYLYLKSENKTYRHSIKVKDNSDSDLLLKYLKSHEGFNDQELTPKVYPLIKEYITHNKKYQKLLSKQKPN